MGLRDLFGGKKHRLVAVGTKKSGRRTGATDKTPRKRRTALEIAQDRFLLDLQQSNPALFSNLMLKRLGLGAEDQGDDLDRLLKLDEKIQKLQRIRGSGPGATNDSSGAVGILRDVLQAMPAARDILAMQKDGQETQQASTPSSAQIPPAVAAPANPPSAPVSPPPEPLGALLVRELEHRNPTEASDFLRHRQAHYPELTRFLTELVNVPDAFLGSVITQIRALAGWEQVGELLARKGETWLKETRDELRKHLAPAAASSNGHAEAPTDGVRVTGL